MGILDFFSKRGRGREAEHDDGLTETWWSDPAQCERVVYAYHEQTKHGLQRFAAGPFELDWANQPDPFRRWEGAQLLSLELVPPTAQPTLDGALMEGGVPPATLDRRSMSQLLFDSLALSAWKEAGDARWALRVNPSSGNLHPTEGYFLTPAVPGLCERPTVFHYAPREHGLEVRAEMPQSLWDRLADGQPPGSFFAGFTSIHWRESWKYGERAFRYCQHDTGHALAALSIAAAGLGWKVELIDELGTLELAELLGVFAELGPEAEHPECLLLVSPQGSATAPQPAGAVAAEFRNLAWQGRPNDLSSEHVEWDAIELVAKASLKPRTEAYAAWQRERSTRPIDRGSIALREIVRQRRSCLALDGRTGMSAPEFFHILESTLPRAGRCPFNAFPWSPRVHLALFVHRVEGLEPGLYWLQRDPARAEAVRAACRPEFLWAQPEGCPEHLPLSLLLPMDLRNTAVQLACNQDIAGTGAFSLGMIVDFERSIAEHGPWFYPRLFWETGAVGQILYLEAEALGLRSTGIGCFFDDPVHSILGLRGRILQSLYHFTVGKPVADPRLTTLAAYPQRGAGADGP
ncbi:MAG: SagB/ThcOx family dehydrogenase [Planctomycetota bacterium]|nr:MAG: SagB/ThcOx family dehydrogenase [Planctomycetota bacterium]